MSAAAASYGFYGRLSEGFPSQIILDTTEVCNLACIHCPHPDFKKSPHYAGRSLDSELNAKVVEEVRDHGRGVTQYIRYTGEGEPLIHPGIFALLDYTVRASGVPVTLTTNGTLLTDVRIEKLLETKLDLVDISIDALSLEAYAAIRVNGDLAVTRGNVQRLIRRARASNSKTKIVVSFVEQPQNTAEAEGFEAFWKGEGADFVVIRRLHSGAGAVTPIAEGLLKDAASAARRPCLYPWERIVLNPRGELVFCPQDWVHGSVVADYRTTTIREVWQGDFYRALREAHLKSAFARHPFCGQCPDWKSTRWPEEGRSYADMVQEFQDQG